MRGGVGGEGGGLTLPLDSPDHGAVHGAGCVRQDRAMNRQRTHRARQVARWARQRGDRRTSSRRTAGRGAGAAEIEDGAAVDAIAACIGPQGGDESSGSADDRFAARIEGLVEAQREIGTRAAEWAQGREPDAGKRTGLFVIESVRTQALLKIADLTEREEPVSTDELARLALTLYRIEDADRRRVAREQAAADMPARPAERKLPYSRRADRHPPQGGQGELLPRTLGRAAVEGRDGTPPRLPAPTPTPPRRTRRPDRVSTGLLGTRA